MTREIVHVIAEFSDGSRWAIPAERLAQSYADYYSESKEEFEDNFDYIMSDDRELLDWATNNADWEDVEIFARYLGNSRTVNYNKEWANAEKSVSRKPVLGA
jgi:hypothetical protein